MNRGRVLGAALAIVSLAGLGVSSALMAERLGGRRVDMVWFSQPIGTPEFVYRGETARIETVDPVPGDPPGVPTRVTIRWRGQALSVDVVDGQRDDPRLPGLLRHDDWMRVLVLAEGGRSEADLVAGLREGRVHARCVVAMRLPAEGFDAGSWGLVRRRDWRYRFVELVSDGPAERSLRVTESTYHDLDRLGDPDSRRAEGREGDAWLHYAMQHVTPPTLYRSRNRPVSRAMEAMGWTWPAAGASVLGLAVGLMLVGMSGLGSGPGRRERASF